ncbi:MAG: class I SAM-dependent methyltransferase [Chloracidobacterium sp.]|nr:class I SAM-dependent methyltransferase [Chloracidobacterium sp.]
MIAGGLRKFLYKWEWGTRCRNVDISLVLAPYINSETTFLDAGCGEYGLSGFVPSKSIVGVDVLPTDVRIDGFSFVRGSIISLPFSERAFSVAASVDVLEHLPESIRADAVRQLVRIADKVILIAFPSGEASREMDEEFNQELADTDQPIPDWLAEHLENPYPDTDAVVREMQSEARRIGRKIKTTVFYSEDRSVAQFLRRLALKSKYLYMVGNLIAGVLLPVLPRAKSHNAYRSIILAEFEND